MENPINILVVEDDTNINNLLKTALEKAGYQVIQAFSGTEAELVLQMQKSVSLVLLDLMLPGISGEEVLKSIREKGNLPVIVLTAKDSLDEKIGLLTQGADDYITKPFELPEVLARIQVQLRHAGRETGSGRLAYKDLVLDKTNYQVKIGESEIPRITKQEFAILELLVTIPGRSSAKKIFFLTPGRNPIWEKPRLWMCISAISAKSLKQSLLRNTLKLYGASVTVFMDNFTLFLLLICFLFGLFR